MSMKFLKALKSLRVVLVCHLICLFGPSAMAQLTIPDGFDLVAAKPGVRLYRKIASDDGPHFVQVINMDEGAKLKLIQGPYVPYPGGCHPDPTPRFQTQPIAHVWQGFKSLHDNAFSVSNGVFWGKTSNVCVDGEGSGEFTFALKDDNRLIVEGYGNYESGLKKQLMIWDGDAEIDGFEGDSCADSNLGSAPTIIVGFDESVLKGEVSDERTFMGVLDRDNDNLNETLLILNTDLATQPDAAAILRSFGSNDVVMLDGGGSTQLLALDNQYVHTSREVPQWLGVISGTEVTPSFADVGLQDWFRPYVEIGFEEGILNGFSDGTFGPSAHVTREEVLGMAYRAAGHPTNCTIQLPSFQDIDPSQEFYYRVTDAFLRNYVEGEPCPGGAGTCFYPDRPVTRAEALKIITEVFGVNELDPDSNINITDPDEQITFPDVNSSDWFHDYVFWVANSRLEDLDPDFLQRGIKNSQRLVRGYPSGSFGPHQLVNRAEMAKIIVNIKLYLQSQSGSRIGSKRGSGGATSIGANFEQFIFAQNPGAPIPVTLSGGNQQTIASPFRMTGPTQDSDGDSLFYFWTANGGSFVTHDPENHASVTWNPPVVQVDTVFSVTVTAGDGRGKVAQGNFLFTVPGGGPNDPPIITILEPDGNDDVRDQNFLIQWNATDDGDATLSLFYDSNAIGFNGTSLVEKISVHAPGQYNWDISALAEGNYFIHATIDDGVNPIEEVYSSGAVTVQHANSGAIAHEGALSGAFLNGAADVKVLGDYAYLASRWANALTVIDISDPENPILAGVAPLSVSSSSLFDPVAVAVQGNFAYLVAKDEGALAVVDIGDPTNPVQVGQLFHGQGGAQLSSPTSIVVSGNDAFVASESGDLVAIVDIANPSNPSHRSSISHGQGGAILEGAFGLDLVGDTLYVTAKSADALTLIDVSNRSNPIHIASVSRFENGVEMDEPVSVKVQGQYAYVGGDHMVEIIDISDVNNLHSVGLYFQDLANKAYLHVRGGYVYVASDGSDKLLVIDVSDPDQPVQAAALSSGGSILLDEPLSVFLAGDHAFVASFSSDALEIADVSAFNLNAIPTLEMRDPDTPGTVDLAFPFRWYDGDDGNATLHFFYDTDNQGEDGIPINTVPIMEDDPEDLHVWNTSLVPDGSYYIYGIINDGFNAPVVDYSPGSVSVDHPNAAPSLAIVEPDGSGDVADTLFTIRWTDSDPDDNAAILFYYDTDNTGEDGVLINGSPIYEDDESDQLLWFTASLPEGDYFLYGEIHDGHSSLTVYSPGPVTVVHNQSPAITLTEPDGADDVTMGAYLIQWQDSDPDHDALISLYYDADSSGQDGVRLAEGISEDDQTDSHLWDTAAVPSGTYFIYAVIEDGVGPSVTAYSAAPVTLFHPDEQGLVGRWSFDETAGNLIGESVNELHAAVTGNSTPSPGRLGGSWLLDAADSRNKIYLPQTAQTFEEGAMTFSIWVYPMDQETQLQYILNHYNWRFFIDDALQFRFTVGRMNDASGPFFSVAGNQPVVAGRWYHLCGVYQPDPSGGNGQVALYINGAFQSSANIDNHVMYAAYGSDDLEWGNSGHGTANPFHGRVDETKIWARSLSAGEILADYQIGNAAPTLSLLEPDGINDLADQSFTITWQDGDPDDNAKISLYYDEDHLGQDGNLIAEDIEEDDPADLFVWNTQAIADGEYFIYGVIDDGLEGPQVSYSAGVVTVNHPMGNGAPQGMIDEPSGPTTVRVGESVLFAGSGTDPDGHLPLTFLWDFDGGAAGSSQEVPGEIAFSSTGIYVVSLTVTDSQGLADPTPATRTVTVVQDQPPNGVITNPSEDVGIQPGEGVAFTGFATDPEDDLPFEYLWHFAGAAPDSILQNPGTIIFSEPGVFVVTLTVTDSLGLADPTPAQRRVVVSNTTAPNGLIDTPTGPVSILAGASVNFTGTGIDPDGGTLSYSWDFDGGAATSHLEDPGPVAFENPGVYTVRFRVRDEQGVADPSPPSRMVTVDTVTPHATIDAPQGNLTILPGESVDFQGTGIDPGNNLPLAFLWDFDGGAPNRFVEDPGPTVFNEPGDYRVRFDIRNSQGQHDPTPDTRMISVLGNQRPEGLITHPPADLEIPIGTTLQFSGSGQDPDEHTPLSWLWQFEGIAQDSTLQFPDPVIFNQAGTYTVTLTVADNTGLADLTPALRIITVLEEEAPDGLIETPSQDVWVRRGEAVQFEGAGIDPDENYPLGFLWDFDGAATATTTEDPGPIPFEESGLFHVSLQVTDSRGNQDPTPDLRQVTVVHCPDVRVPSVALGLEDPALSAVMPCDLPEVTWLWRNLTTGDFFGMDENPVVLVPIPFENTIFQIELVDQITGETGTTSAAVLVPLDVRFLDFDGDGCNSERDLWMAASMWLQGEPDADGDHRLTIADLLYIHLPESTCP